MARKLKPDRILFFVTLTLVAFGVAMVFSSSAVMAKEKFGDPNYFAFKQLLAATIGFAVMFIVMKVDYHAYRHPGLVFSVLALVVALLVLVFFLASQAATHRWIVLPGLRFQPSELAKISLILFLAWTIDRRKERIQEWRVLLVPLGVILSFVLLILKEPDFGTALLTFAVCAVVLFIGGVRLKYFAYMGLGSVPFFAYFLFVSPYRMERLLGFLSPDKNLSSTNFQVLQSKLAVGAGGLLGVSLGEGAQKMYFLPCPHTDFIFAVIGEELGLLGTVATLVLFALFVWRGLVIVMKAPNPFSQLTAAGLTILIAAQALLNITVVLGLGPAKGVPLPLLSFGRSSLMTTLLAVGILLHISQRKEINRVNG